MPIYGPSSKSRGSDPMFTNLKDWYEGNNPFGFIRLPTREEVVVGVQIATVASAAIAGAGSFMIEFGREAGKLTADEVLK